jgi:DNA invertase Pin-like site-specific DNA recombinase
MRPCTVCAHEKRQEIDKALITGTTHRNVAEQFRLSPSAVYRHKQSHVAARIKRAFEASETRKAVELVQHQTQERAKEVGQAIDVVQQLKAINSACLEVLAKSRTDGKHSLSLQAVDRIHRQIELQAKLLGELQEAGPQVNVFVASEWCEIRVHVLQALTPYPEARAAVAEVLTVAGP